MSPTFGTVLDGFVGAGGAQRKAALGLGLCPGAIAGRRAKVYRTDGLASAGWEWAGDAAVRGAESVEREAARGAAEPADGKPQRPGGLRIPVSGFPSTTLARVRGGRAAASRGLASGAIAGRGEGTNPILLLRSASHLSLAPWSITPALDILSIEKIWEPRALLTLLFSI